MGKSRKTTERERAKRWQRLMFLAMQSKHVERDEQAEADEAHKIATWNAVQAAAKWVASERGY